MENKAHALAAGIFVVLLTALVLALAAWLTRDTGVRERYQITTRDTVTGLQPQAAVRFRGVDVGKVAAVGFDPQAVGNVLIELEIDRDAPLTRSTYATLSYQGVTGLAFIQLGDDGTSEVRLEPNDAAPPRIPLRPGMLAKLEERGEVILQRVEEVAGRVNQLLGDDNQRRLAQALENISRTAEATNKLVTRFDATVERRLDPALVEATTALQAVRSSAAAVERTADEFARTAQVLNAPDGPVQQLTAGARSLTQASETFSSGTLPHIQRMTDEASRTLRDLRRTANNLTENPQSLVYGSGTPLPGPGEPGFAAAGAAR